MNPELNQEHHAERSFDFHPEIGYNGQPSIVSEFEGKLIVINNFFSTLECESLVAVGHETINN